MARFNDAPKIVRLRPAITSAAAASFQPRQAVRRGRPPDEIMPKTGTSRAKGVMVVAGWRASSQLHSEYATPGVEK